MVKMDWHTPTLKDIEILQKSACNNSLFGNNYSAVNSFLYNLKYNSQIAIYNNWVFEKYSVEEGAVFNFPHNIDGDNTDLQSAISLLESESKELNQPCVFRNITSKEKDMLLKINPQILVTDAPELSDYIYLTENLASLPGSKYSKKRNHINQFIKKYPDYRFEVLTAANLDEAREVEEKWLDGSTDEDLLTEQKIIYKAFDNFEQLANLCSLTGGLIYIQNQPIAFCLASTLSSEITDIHFEKCIEPFAHDGGYAIINKEFAKTVTTKYLNREEDLGIEGLRKAKLSYYPEIILEKFIVLQSIQNKIKVTH